MSKIISREWYQRFKISDLHVQKRPNMKNLEYFRDEVSCQTQEQLARSLGMSRQAISKCLKNLGMIHMQGYWVARETQKKRSFPWSCSVFGETSSM